MIIDLHNHSNHSDGKMSVKALIEYAKKKGVDVMALTDHDSVFGLNEAKIEAQRVGITVISGIELSTYHNGESVHIIGLFKKGEIPLEVIEKSESIKKERYQRAIDMMNKIRDIFGVKINLDELLKSEVITRGNMFQHILKYNPDKTVDEINFMVSHKSGAYIEASKFDTKSGIEFLKRNNCITIYAHPTLNSRKTNLDVVQMGVDGIEYRYPKNQEGDEEFYYNLAKDYNLYLSAGSDFHSDVNHADIGTSTLDEEDYLKLKEGLMI